MTQEEILEYNKRCAELLGAEHYIPKAWYYFPQYREHYYFKNRYYPNRFTIKMMKFHSDWNWIMEVVDNILEKCSNLDNMEIYYKILDAFPKKEAVVEAINQFLTHYENENENS